MGVKVKYRGQFIDADEAAFRREQDRDAVSAPSAPVVDVAALPAKEELDPDVPLAQLFYERPEVRAYISKDGKVRSGLTPTERATAEAIVAKYGRGGQ